MTLGFYGLAIGILCTWRLTYLFYAEDGPWNAVLRLRERVRAATGTRVFDCFYCLSLWVAVPFAVLLGDAVLQMALHWMAFSAGAILLERVAHRADDVPPAPYFEEREDEDVMLR